MELKSFLQGHFQATLSVSNIDYEVHRRSFVRMPLKIGTILSYFSRYSSKIQQENCSFLPSRYLGFVSFFHPTTIHSLSPSSKILWNISINVKNLLKFIHIITSPRHQKSQRTLYPTNPHAFIHCSIRKNAPNGEAKLHAFLFLILNALWHISTHFIYKESEKNDWYREFKTMLIGRRTAPVYSRLREKSKPKTAITTQNQISGAHIVNFPI